MSDRQKLFPGMKVYFEPYGNRGLHSMDVTVTRVGKKWAYSDDLRRCQIDVETFRVYSPGYGGIGQIYADKQARIDEVAETKKRDELRKVIVGLMGNHGTCPIPSANLEAALKILEAKQ